MPLEYTLTCSSFAQGITLESAPVTRYPLHTPATREISRVRSDPAGANYREQEPVERGTLVHASTPI